MHYNIHLWSKLQIFLVYFVFNMNSLHFFLNKLTVISNFHPEILKFFESCMNHMISSLRNKYAEPRKTGKKKNTNYNQLRNKY